MKNKRRIASSSNNLFGLIPIVDNLKCSTNK